MTATLEYGIRATLAGGDTVELEVGDAVLQRQRIVELLDEGASDVEPLTRPRTPWTVDEPAKARIYRERAREAVLSIAQRFWEEEINPEQAVEELAAHSDLPAERRAELLGELVSELEHEEDVIDDRVQPGPGEDRQSLEEDAERRVNEAADRLAGAS